MADTTTLKKLMGIFNNYIADNTATSFSEFCTAHSYTMTDGKGNTILNTDEINKLTDVDHLDFSKADQNIIQHKLEEIIGFIYNHNRQIPYSIKELNITLKDIINYLEENGKHLSFSDEEADKLVDKFHTSVDIGDITVPKTKRKTLWATKKIGIPTAITAGACGIISGIVTASGAVVGSLLFLTDSILLNVATMASLGVIFGAIAATIVIVAKNAITRAYYKYRYGRKSASLKMLLDNDIKSKEDINSLDLPIVKLMKLIDATNEKLNRYKTEKVNPFKKAWRTVKSYFLNKVNRNRRHEVVNFKEMLESKMDSATTKAELDKYKLLYGYMDNFWGDDLLNDYSKRRKHADSKGKTTKRIKVQADIIAKADMTKKDKKSKDLVLARAKKLIQRAILRNMLTGKAGSVLDHKFNNFGEAETADSEVVNIPATRITGGHDIDDVTTLSTTYEYDGSDLIDYTPEETTTSIPENDEEEDLPLLVLARQNTEREAREAAARATSGSSPTSSSKESSAHRSLSQNIKTETIKYAEGKMLIYLITKGSDYISRKTNIDINIIKNFAAKLLKKQADDKILLNSSFSRIKTLGDDPLALYLAILRLDKNIDADGTLVSALDKIKNGDSAVVASSK